MGDLVFDIKAIDSIIKKTVDAIDDAKSELYDIVENLRQELTKLREEFKNLDSQIKKTTVKIKLLEVELGKAKSQLLNVSRNYRSYSEMQIKDAYEKADSIRIDLSVCEEKEKNLFSMRSNTEFKIKNTNEMMQKASKMLNQVGVAMNYLSGDLHGLSDQLEDIRSRQVFAMKILKAQEQERYRMAREIHDGPAQTMANLILKAELCDKLIDIKPDAARNEINNLKSLVRDSLKEVRKIIYDLRPMALDDLGVIPTIERYATNFGNENGFYVEFIEKGEIPNKNSTTALTIFRIVQEALNNIKKHANAKNVKLVFIVDNNLINIKIEDDGKGFDINNMSAKSSENIENNKFGLAGMEERVKLLEGKFSIISKINEGTKVIISLPLSN